jgi:butyryl-CoA dehydrogenase
MASPEPSWHEIFPRLEALANDADSRMVWPAASWECLRQIGGLRWCIPAAFGGGGLTGISLLEHYERLAGSCLTTCFILSQRDAACRRILDQGGEAWCRQLLPALGEGETFTTVGLSHLTTSRQHVEPAVTAVEQGDFLILNGTIPWVTGAGRATYILTGAVLPDHQQILVILPCNSEGVRIGPPLDLMALAGSLTAQVRLESVRLERKWLMAGPAERVLEIGRGGAGGLETSCLAVGLAGAAVDYLSREASARPELRTPVERLEQTRQALRTEIARLAKPGATGKEALDLRARANTFALRATQAALTAAKGTGFLRDHPAQRWARQAMFFLVWSCPRPAAEATLEYLTPPEGCAGPF